MDNLEIQTAKDYPIVELAWKLGIEVLKSNTCKCVNPNHDDKHPSMSFDKKRNRFRCFSCNVSGDTIELVKLVSNRTFSECVEFIVGKKIDTSIYINKKVAIKDGLVFFCDKCNRKINKVAQMILSKGETNKYCDYCSTQVYGLLMWESLYD